MNLKFINRKRFTYLLSLLIVLSAFLYPIWRLNTLYIQPNQTKTSKESITLLSFPEQNKEHLEAILADSVLDFEVEIIEVPQNQYEEKVRMHFVGNSSTDLILIDAPNIASYAMGGWIEPLNQYWEAKDYDDLVDASKQALQWNQQIWAAPLNESSCVLFYNKKLLQAEGIKPTTSMEDAWDLDTLLDAAIRLTKRDSQGNIYQYGFQPTLFTPDNKNEGMAYSQMLFTWWFGGQLLSMDQKSATGFFDSPANIAALEFYGDLHNKYQVAPIHELLNGFETGKVGMMINGPWMLGVWRDNFPAFDQEVWGVMPLPHGEAFASPSGSWNLAIASSSTQKDKAWQVMQALTGKDGMQAWCENTGNVPARKSVLQNNSRYTEEDIYRIISQQQLSSARLRPITPVYPYLSQVITEAFNSVAYGKSAKVAVAQATQKMNGILMTLDPPLQTHNLDIKESP